MKTLYTLIALFIFGTTATYAQFQIDAQYRIRSQFLHGYKMPAVEDADPAFHIGQRTRLNLRYNDTKNKFSTMLSLQDVRVWGDENIVNPTGVQGKSFNTVDIYEAWVKFSTGDYSSLKIGRQEMKYDDQRHISYRNWWDRGQTYDAILYSYKHNGLQIDLSGSFNSKKEDLFGNDYSDGTDYFGTVNPMITQNFIYLKKDFGKYYISLTGIGTGYQEEGTKDVIHMTYTEGVHLNYNATKKATDGIFGKFNAFIQNGKNINGQKVNAHMITGTLGLRTLNKQLEISANYELLSGNDGYNSDVNYTNTDHTYNLLYGGCHPYYDGYIDWFTTPKSSFYAGLQNYSFKLKYKFNKKNMLLFGFNYITLGNNVKKTVNGNLISVDKGSNVAQNFDFTFIKGFNKTIKLISGFSYAIASDEYLDLKNITNPGTDYYFYTMLSVTPKLFSSNK